ALIEAAVSSALPRSMSLTATRAPARASASAVGRPVPPPAPVMIAALPPSTLWVVIRGPPRSYGRNGFRTGRVVLRIRRHGERDPVHQSAEAAGKCVGELLVAAAHEELVEYVVGKRGRHVLPAPLAGERQQPLADVLPAEEIQ